MVCRVPDPTDYERAFHRAGTEAERLYELLTNGDLWRFTAGAWTKMDSTVQQFLLDSQGVLYSFEQSGALWRFKNNAWTLLDSGVKQVGLATNDTLIDLETNGSLWKYVGTTWTKLDTGVTSFDIVGNQVTAHTPVGDHVFNV